jgi:hypothetical protein
LKNEIRILLLEDNPIDADLIYHALKRSELAFSWRHVDNGADFTRELKRRRTSGSRTASSWSCA